MPKTGRCDLCADGVVHKDVRQQQAPLHGQQVGSGTGAWWTLCTKHYFIAGRHNVVKKTGEWWERLKSQPTRWRDNLAQTVASGILVSLPPPARRQPPCSNATHLLCRLTGSGVGVGGADCC